MSKRGVMLRDPVSDLFTRIRNAYMAKRASLTHPYSRQTASIVSTLIDCGYLSKMEVRRPVDPRKAQFDTMHIDLKYDAYGNPAIRKIRRVSKPSRRMFRSIHDIPLSRNGLGCWIMSTPKGIMHCAEARNKQVGGEVLGEVF